MQDISPSLISLLTDPTPAGSQRMLDVLKQLIKQLFHRGVSPAAAGGASYPWLCSYRGTKRQGKGFGQPHALPIAPSVSLAMQGPV